MATLSEAQRDAVHRAFMRKISRLRWSVSGYNKAELRQAVGEMDTALDSSFTTINAALNDSFRNGASAEEKALMLAFIAGVRTGGAFDPPEMD